MRLSAQEAFQAYADRVYAAAYTLLRSPEDAEDVVQDTFLKYCGMTKDFESSEHIKAWLLRLAINRSKDIQRQFWRRNVTGWEDYEGNLEFQEPQDRELFAAVMALQKKYRTVIHLYYYEDYSIRQIAQVLGSTESAVKTQLSRGRKILKSMLMEAWNDDE